MKNIGIYIITFIISLIMIIFSLLFTCSFTNVLSGIGCSGFAAAIMAIFLERANDKRESEKITKAKALYFKRLYDQLIIAIERIIWFNERLKDDSFEWEYSDDVYSTMNYMAAMSEKYPSYSLDYDEAIKKLKDIGERYSLDNIKLLDEKEAHKVNRLFQIVAAGSSYLLKEAKIINDNMLILDIEDYISIEENEKILNDISIAVGLMLKTDKNYKVAIVSLISAIETLRKIGKYTNGVDVGLHGSISLSEL